MIDQLGRVGIVGMVIAIAGQGLIALADPLVAAGVSVLIIGTGLIVQGLLTSALDAMGMSGML